MFFASILTFVSSYGQDTLSLQTAIEIGLKHNFNIRLAYEDINIANHNYTRGNAGMLPSLDLSAGASKSSSNTKQEFVTGNNVDKKDARATQYNAELALNWTLFDGLKMFVNYEKLEAIRNQSEQLFKIQVEDFVYKLSLQYALLAKLQLALKYDREMLQLAKEQYDWTQKKFEIEEGRKTDLLQSEIELNRQKVNLISKQRELLSSKRIFNQLLSRNPETELAVEDEKGLSTNTLQNFDPAQILQKNLNLKLLESDKKIAEFELKELKTEFYPKLLLNAAYSYNKTENQAGFLLFNRNHGWNANLTAQWNLFNGYQLRREIANSKIQILKSSLHYEAYKLESITKLRDAFNAFMTAKEILQLEERNNFLSKAQLDLVSLNYQSGEALFLELKEAKAQFENSIHQMVEYKYLAKAAELEYLRIQGDLIK